MKWKIEKHEYIPTVSFVLCRPTTHLATNQRRIKPLHSLYIPIILEFPKNSGKVRLGVGTNVRCINTYNV